MKEFGRKGLGIGLLVAAFGVGCAPAANQERSGAPQASENRQQPQLVEHVTPRRDFVGPAPTVFTWTAIDGADTYSVGIWNEVDVMVWRQDGIPTTSMPVVPELRLEPGTYMWSVSALRGEQEISQSGLAAFVVRTTP